MLIITVCLTNSNLLKCHNCDTLVYHIRTDILPAGKSYWHAYLFFVNVFLSHEKKHSFCSFYYTSFSSCDKPKCWPGIKVYSFFMRANIYCSQNSELL